MSLKQLNIHHLRNLSSLSIRLHPQINVFHGANGSGKTALLEAVYLLGNGHSFRTRETLPLIQHDNLALTVFAKTATDDAISIEKTVSGGTRVQLNQQACPRSSELARFLPCQVFYQDIFQIVDAGPAIRRMVLDWGLFHVKQSYHGLWKDYYRALKQRNKLLRQKVSYQHCASWDALLGELGTEIDGLRSAYMDRWSGAFQHLLAQLTDIPCDMHYYKGWDKKETGKSLAAVLKEQFDGDLQRQYTHAGIHQADVTLSSASHKAKQVWSRGQQKVILIALKLAQSQLLEKPCVYLFDDISAELDAPHLSRLLQCFLTLRGQFFLTAIDVQAIQQQIRGDSIIFFDMQTLNQ